MNTPDGKKQKKPKVEEEKVETPQNVATQGHFSPMQKRAKKVLQLSDEIIAYQQWAREKKADFVERIRSLSSSFFNLMVLQILVVIGSAAFSVVNLRRFFVKKHIY